MSGPATERACPLPSCASLFLPKVMTLPESVRQTVWLGPIATSTTAAFFSDLTLVGTSARSTRLVSNRALVSSRPRRLYLVCRFQW